MCQLRFKMAWRPPASSSLIQGYCSIGRLLSILNRRNLPDQIRPRWSPVEKNERSAEDVGSFRPWLVRNNERDRAPLAYGSEWTGRFFTER